MAEYVLTAPFQFMYRAMLIFSSLGFYSSNDQHHLFSVFKVLGGTSNGSSASRLRELQEHFSESKALARAALDAAERAKHPEDAKKRKMMKSFFGIDCERPEHQMYLDKVLGSFSPLESFEFPLWEWEV